MPAGCDATSFLSVVGTADDGEVGAGEHAQRDVPVPGVVAADLVLVEARLARDLPETPLDPGAGTAHPAQLPPRRTGGGSAPLQTPPPGPGRSPCRPRGRRAPTPTRPG